MIGSYLMLCRSKEEISMLKEDADNCVTYYKNKKCVILQEISKRSHYLIGEQWLYCTLY